VDRDPPAPTSAPSPPPPSRRSRLPARSLAVGTVLAAGLLFSWPLLTRPALPDGSDAIHHLQLAHAMIDGLADGHLYPRWVSPVNRALGGPVLLFYPPLTSYAVALARTVTADVTEAVRLWMVLAALLSGVSAYFALRPLSGELGAALGAVLYVLLPYHALDLYDRFALAEFGAFVFMPLLFRFGADLVYRPALLPWLGMVVSGAALVMTHVLTAYMLAFVLGPYLLAIWLPERRLRPVLAVGSAALVGFLLVAVFVVPMLVERSWVNLEWNLECPVCDWRRNLLYRNETALGFKPARIGPSVDRIGNLQLVLTLAAAGWLLLRHGLRPASRAARHGLLFAGLGVFAWLLQTPIAGPLYRVVPELATLQFPWRFSALQLLCAAFACALAAAPSEAVEGLEARRRLLRSPALAAGLLLAFAAPAISMSIDLWEDRKWSLTEQSWSWLRESTRLEYAPHTAEDWRVARRMIATLPEIVSTDPPFRAEVRAWTTQERRIAVDTEAAATIAIRTFYYPGWVAEVDGVPTETRPHSKLGLLAAEIPAGSRELVFRFDSLPHRRAAGGVSVATALGLVVATGVRLARSRARSVDSAG